MALETKTEHPYVVKVEGVRGGRPVVKGTGIEVALVVKLYKMGSSADELLSLYPNLTPAAVYDALSYYHDHQDEIERYLTDQSLENVLRRNDLTINNRGRVVPTKK